MRTCLLSLALTLGLLATGAAQQPLQLPGGHPLEQVDFGRHIAPLLTRLGCNAGSCHGAAEGQAGFRLSLFGFDPAWDYAALMEPGTGRVDLMAPGESLVLTKPTLAVDHEGGLRLQADSWEYHILHRWITAGAPHIPGSGRLRSLELEPGESLLTEASPTAKVRVLATYADGQQLDVTPLAQLRVQDDAVATVNEAGMLTRVAVGDTALIATYNGWPANSSILAPQSGDEPEFAASGDGLIDRFIDERLRRLRIAPAPPCSDETFLRRVTLATTGQLPTPDAIRQFVTNEAPGKRVEQIERLLCDPVHSAVWATRMSEITGSRDYGSQSPPEGHEVRWHAWLRARFAENTPYDQLVRDILCGTTRDQFTPAEFIEAEMTAAEQKQEDEPTAYAAHASLDLFWRRPSVNEEIDLESITERVSAAFLGVRMECARCHKHPFDRWTQRDHRSLANVFAQVRFGQSPELRAALVDALEAQRARVSQGEPARRVPPLREIYVAPTWNDLRDPQSQERLPARPLAGDLLEVSGDRRRAFADWLADPANPFFARNFVNRVWEFYFGVGLVAPVDAFSRGNPPSHPELLDALARDFVEHGFNLRRLEQQILTSAAWQRAAVADEAPTAGRPNYARAYVRVLRADAVVDAIRCAIGDEAPLAVEVPSRRTDDSATNTYFEVFQRPERKLTCDCEQNHEPTLRQAMLLLSDPELLTRISQGHVARLAAAELSDEALVDELFLLSLSRWPHSDERHAAFAHLSAADTRANAARDILWSLINTREFITHH